MRHRDVDVVDGTGEAILSARERWEAGLPGPNGSTVFTHTGQSTMFTERGDVTTSTTEATTVDFEHSASSVIESIQDGPGVGHFTTTTIVHGVDRDVTGHIDREDGSTVDLHQTWHGNSVEQHRVWYDDAGQEMKHADTTATVHSGVGGTQTEIDISWESASGGGYREHRTEVRHEDGHSTQRWEAEERNDSGERATTHGASTRDADGNESVSYSRTNHDGSTKESTATYDSHGHGSQRVVEKDSHGHTTSDATRPATREGDTTLPPGDESDFPDSTRPRPGRDLITSMDGGDTTHGYPPEWGIAAGVDATGAASLWPAVSDMTGQGDIVNSHLGALGWEVGPSQPPADWGLVAAPRGVGEAIRTAIVTAGERGWLTSGRVETGNLSFHARTTTDAAATWGELSTPEQIVTAAERVAAQLHQLQAAEYLQSSKHLTPIPGR